MSGSPDVVPLRALCVGGTAGDFVEKIDKNRERDEIGEEDCD